MGSLVLQQYILPLHTSTLTRQFTEYIGAISLRKFCYQTGTMDKQGRHGPKSVAFRSLIIEHASN
jgi:hypothetical protein